MRSNGQGTVFKRGNTWTAQITLWTVDAAGKKKRSYKTKGGFKLKRDALSYIGELKDAKTQNASITFNAMYVAWSTEHYKKIFKDAENGYRAAYAKCGGIYFKQFSELKAADLQEVVDSAKSLDGKELSRRSKADIKSLFNNLYTYAMKNDYCEKNYAKFVELPKKSKSKKDAFTKDEIDKLWKDYDSGNDFTGYILIMIYTGMRYGEISTIKKENIHLKERYMIGGIKTDAGIDREIPISEKIFPIVQKFYSRNEKKLLEMNEKVFYNSYYVATEKVGIRRLNPHCCRHTFFTLMSYAGVQPAVITETGGHEDYSTTMQYTHIKLDEKLEAVNRL